MKPGSHFSNEDRTGNKSKHSFFMFFLNQYIVYVCLKFDIHLLFQPLLFFLISAVLLHFIIELSNLLKNNNYFSK